MSRAPKATERRRVRADAGGARSSRPSTRRDATRRAVQSERRCWRLACEDIHVLSFHVRFLRTDSQLKTRIEIVDSMALETRNFLSLRSLWHGQTQRHGEGWPVPEFVDCKIVATWWTWHQMKQMSFWCVCCVRFHISCSFYTCVHCSVKALPKVSPALSRMI